MKKKILAIFLVMIMGLNLLIGCGSDLANTANKETTSESNTEAEVAEVPATPTPEPVPAKEVVTITAMVYDRGDEYASGYSLTDNLLTRWINEQLLPLGVQVEWIPVPRADSDVNINMMISGGSAPDVIYTYSKDIISAYSAMGGLVDLSGYMDYLDADYKEKYADAIADCVVNGGQYAIPSIFGYYGKSNETYIRQDIVEELGEKMPTTKAELIELFYKVKEAYPDMKVYGFSAKNQFTMYTTFMLGYTSRANERENYMYEPSATIVLKPGHKDALKQLNQFYLDGIITNGFIEDTDMSIFLEDVANGNVFFIADDGSDAFTAYSTVENDKYHMVAIDCIENLDGSYEVPSQGFYSNYVYVPVTAMGKIDAVMTFLGWCSKEENAINTKHSIIGVGSELNAEGWPILKDTGELLAQGNTQRGGDFTYLYSNFPDAFKYVVESSSAAWPDAPMDVVEGKLASQYSNYFNVISAPVSLDNLQNMLILQSLIPNFVFACVAAPEGEFEAVYAKEYQILLDNHLQKVLDDRAAYYDTYVAGK